MLSKGDLTELSKCIYFFSFFNNWQSSGDSGEWYYRKCLPERVKENLFNDSQKNLISLKYVSVRQRGEEEEKKRMYELECSKKRFWWLILATREHSQSMAVVEDSSTHLHALVRPQAALCHKSETWRSNGILRVLQSLICLPSNDT